MTIASMRAIRAFARRIVREFRPQRIILFGSYAYGKPTGDSDVDLLVVMKCSVHPVDQSIEIRRRISAPFPLDLLVFEPKELNQQLRRGNYFLDEIVKKGITLHDARRAAVA
ncbi:MAG: nucleotidyltransferase domain-containing protein [Phycisphaerae bacterium]|nr:nucleotidyltransferase domain-containing protein [Phycisphaerae bacterium]NUQ48204.1 nucleotidyltransferase domain-containing protein [Phycisphaerae bacterium]